MPYFEGRTRLRQWRTSPGPPTAGSAAVHNSYYVVPLNADGGPFPGDLMANTFGMAVSLAHASGSTQAFTSTARIGLYTRSVSTLSLINSASYTFGYGGATSTSATWSSLFNGAKIMAISSSQWSSAPFFSRGQEYWVGFGFATNGFNGPLSFMSGATAISSGNMFGALGVHSTATVSSQGQYGLFRGALSVTTASPPVTIENTAFLGSALTGAIVPWIRLDDDFRNYS